MRAASDPGSGTVDRPVVVQQPKRASPTVAVARALGRRVLVAVATVVAVSMLVFAAIEIVPIDPALHALGRESTPEQRALFRQRMHLDDPPVARYLRWGGNILRGDFGTSVTSGRPVDARSMMDPRRNPKPTGPAMKKPSSSGPRCAIERAMRTIVSGSTGSRRSKLS